MSTPFVIETHALSKTYKNVQALKSLNLKWTGEEGSYEFTATGTGK
jgi:ABC-type sugar transport system ATPase subunit